MPRSYDISRTSSFVVAATPGANAFAAQGAPLLAAEEISIEIVPEPPRRSGACR